MAGLSFDDLVPAAAPPAVGAKKPLTFDDLVAAGNAPPQTGEELRARVYADLAAKREAAKPKPHPPLDTGNQKADFARVYTDELGFGLPGKAGAGLQALAQAGLAALPGESPWEDKSISDLYTT